MIICGDALTELRGLADESVHCCVTSPPYWGLRDYGTAKWEGGDQFCDHKTGRFERGGLSGKQSSNHGSGGDEAKNICPKCGAHRVDSQLGLEPTPEEYVEHLVEVFREVKRVLRDDGTLWLNLGDTFAGGGNYRGNSSLSDKQASNGGARGMKVGAVPMAPGLKPKDLVGIPWRVAFALQADGWWLRSDIIWSKPNPMPESVRDRPTRAHEYIFLMAKAQKYYYDSDAIAEESCVSDKWHEPDKKYLSKTSGDSETSHIKGFNRVGEIGGKRNRRSVWTVATKPFREAHFATFPPDLIRPCILAGCPVGGTVLDPFFGAGTTGLVAKENGRDFIGIELNPKYCEMAERRIGKAAYQMELPG